MYRNGKMSGRMDTKNAAGHRLAAYGGKAGIRTLGTRKGTTVFETAPIDHSGTFPLVFCVCECKVMNCFWIHQIF